MFELLASQHDVIEHDAHLLYEDMLSRGVLPAEIGADGALLQLGLAELAEGSDLLDDNPTFVYHDPLAEIERERVRAALMDDDLEDE